MEEYKKDFKQIYDRTLVLNNGLKLCVVDDKLYKSREEFNYYSKKKIYYISFENYGFDYDLKNKFPPGTTHLMEHILLDNIISPYAGETTNDYVIFKLCSLENFKQFYINIHTIINNTYPNLDKIYLKQLTQINDETYQTYSNLGQEFYFKKQMLLQDNFYFRENSNNFLNTSVDQFREYVKHFWNSLDPNDITIYIYEDYLDLNFIELIEEFYGNLKPTVNKYPNSVLNLYPNNFFNKEIINSTEQILTKYVFGFRDNFIFYNKIEETNIKKFIKRNISLDVLKINIQKLIKEEDKINIKDSYPDIKDDEIVYYYKNKKIFNVLEIYFSKYFLDLKNYKYSLLKFLSLYNTNQYILIDGIEIFFFDSGHNLELDIVYLFKYTEHLVTLQNKELFINDLCYYIYNLSEDQFNEKIADSINFLQNLFLKNNVILTLKVTGSFDFNILEYSNQYVADTKLLNKSSLLNSLNVAMTTPEQQFNNETSYKNLQISIILYIMLKLKKVENNIKNILNNVTNDKKLRQNFLNDLKNMEPIKVNKLDFNEDNDFLNILDDKRFKDTTIIYSKFNFYLYLGITFDNNFESSQKLNIIEKIGVYFSCVDLFYLNIEYSDGENIKNGRLYFTFINKFYEKLNFLSQYDYILENGDIYNNYSKKVNIIKKYIENDETNNIMINYFNSFNFETGELYRSIPSIFFGSISF